MVNNCLRHLKGKGKLLSLAVVLLALSAAVLYGLSGTGDTPTPEKPVPSVSIGCDQVIWKGSRLELQAATKNVENPVFEWTVDGAIAGSTQRLSPTFDAGTHRVVLNVSFEDQTLQAAKSVIVIDSLDGVSLQDSQASKNQWGFQTFYQGKRFGVSDVSISVDSSQPTKVSACGSLTSSPLFAGKHTWLAQYRGTTIASGTFDLRETIEAKITGVEVASSYLAGDTVNGKIVIKNTGTMTVRAFDIRTNVLNHKYEWMGDVAKREYYDTYRSELNPGSSYHIPIRVTIPEKVGGIRPTGRYSITVNLILNGQVTDSRVVGTEVR